MTSASVRRAAGAFAVDAARPFAVEAPGLAAARVEGAGLAATGFAATDFADAAALGLAARAVAGFTDFARGRPAAFFAGFFVGMGGAYRTNGASSVGKHEA